MILGNFINKDVGLQRVPEYVLSERAAMQPSKEAILKTYNSIKKQLNELLDIATPEAHTSFFEKFHISNDQRRAFIIHLMNSLGKNLSQPKLKSATTPKIIHRVWLTDAKEPSLPPEGYLKRIHAQARKLGDEYQYIFWNNSDLASSTFGSYFSDVNIDFRDINTLLSEPKILDGIQHAISVRKFVMAGDMTKFLVLREFGGVYADLGVDFERPLLELIAHSDISLFLDRNLFFQPAFMAAPVNSAPFQTWCRLLAQPEILSAIALNNQPKFSSGHEIWLHGGVGFTASLILFHDETVNILPIPANRGLLHHESQGSWYRPGNKFGNTSMNNAQITHLNWDLHLVFMELNKDLSKRLVGLTPTQIIRITIMRYFQSLYWLK
jgi:hypothetical protein